MSDNQLILEFSPPSRHPGASHKRSITIRTYNAIDTPQNFTQHNSDDNPGYFEAEDLEQLLDWIAEFVKLHQDEVPERFRGLKVVEVAHA